MKQGAKCVKQRTMSVAAHLHEESDAQNCPPAHHSPTTENCVFYVGNKSIIVPLGLCECEPRAAHTERTESEIVRKGLEGITLYEYKALRLC
jgi:hypothetical protein